MVVDMDRVKGQPNERGLDHLVAREAGVEICRVEPRDAVPQRDVGRRRLLGLNRDDATDRLRHRQRLPRQQQLALERRPIQLAGGDRRPRTSKIDVLSPSSGRAYFAYSTARVSRMTVTLI